jgi:hypothetical protein
MHSRKTSSAPRGAFGRRVLFMVPENQDPRPMHCRRRPMSGPQPHRWGTAIERLRIPRAGRHVRIEYCKRSGCRAVREVELSEAAQ